VDRAGIEAGIRTEAARLLADGSVDLVIGFEAGTAPMRTAPCFVKSAEDAQRLVWNSFCSASLARYLRGAAGRAAIVARGCDSRAVVELIREKQLDRGGLVVIGVPCQGMADRRLLPARFSGARIAAVEEAGDDLVVTQHDGTRTAVSRAEVLHSSCRVCVSRNPVIHDVLVSAEVEEAPPDSFGDVDRFASLPRDERSAYVAGELEKCIRCHACRNACPMCYCSRCFADDSRPQWVGRGTDPGDVMSFHLMRAMHLAGRCVECGACARACPVGIDLGVLNRRLTADVARMFGYRPGMDPDAPAPLSTFSADDPQGFILEPGSGCECGK
jgi:formate dehydrogenase (coenzyme F420) beta subunit